MNEEKMNNIKNNRKSITVLIIKLVFVAIMFLVFDWIRNPDKMFFKMENWAGYIGVSMIFIGETTNKIYQNQKKNK